MSAMETMATALFIVALVTWLGYLQLCKRHRIDRRRREILSKAAIPGPNEATCGGKAAEAKVARLQFASPQHSSQLPLPLLLDFTGKW